MKRQPDSRRRTLAHLKRLMCDGRDLAHERPLDEIAHATWMDRAEKYMERKLPDVRIPPPYELIHVEMPDLLSPDYRPSHPLDAAMARAESGRQLMGKMQAILASAIERLELELESDGTSTGRDARA
jgi:hypothetical protein